VATANYGREDVDSGLTHHFFDGRALYGFLCQPSLVRYLLASSGKRPSNMMAKWFNASFQCRTGNRWGRHSCLPAKSGKPGRQECLPHLSIP
jgi:hypothetical protein